jgi:hypothetical protein
MLFPGTRILIVVAATIMTGPIAAIGQVRASVGVGAGLAGTTEGSLSEGRGGFVATAQLTTPGPVGVGIEGDGWWRPGLNIVVATGHLQFQLPSTPLRVTLGAGVGHGDPTGEGAINGAAGHLGASIDIAPHASSLALTLFGNAFLVYSSSRTLQMVDAGLAITRR